MDHLPKLKETSLKVDFTEAGKFVKANNKENLAQILIEGIDVKPTDGKMPSSMPVVYKQPLTISTYLTTPRNWAAVSAGIIQDWRALITIIALNSMNNYEVRFYKENLSSKIDLINKRREMNSMGIKEKDGIKLEDVNNELNKINEFLRLAALTVPKDEKASFEKTNWDEFYVVYYDYKPVPAYDSNKVIGMLSPYTVVCPVETEEFRNLIKGIKGGDRFEFIEYDKDFAKAFSDDSNDFGENCAKIFAKQFKRDYDGFSKTELKAVLEWIRKVKPFCILGGVAYKLFSEFESLLTSIYTDKAFAKEWSYSGSCFAYNSFIEYNEIEASGFSKINFSAKTVPLQREWNAMFVLLALQKLKGLELHLNNNQIGYYIYENRSKRSFVPLIFKSEHTLVEPVSNICEKLPKDSPFHFKTRGSDEYDFNLSEFECECVIQWLKKLSVDPDVMNCMQLSEYIKDFIDALMPDTYNASDVIQTPKKYESWRNNRFCMDCLPISDNNLRVVNFCINDKVAPFYEDYRGKDIDGNTIYGEMHRSILSRWFKLLRTLTFRNSRTLNVEFLEDNENIEENSPLFKAKDYIRYAIRINGIDVAYTSRAMLFEVVRSDILDIELHEYEKFEDLIFIQRLNELYAELTSDNSYIDHRDDDCKIMSGHISKKINELRKRIYEKNDTFDKDIDVVKEYFEFVPDGALMDANSTLRFAGKYVQDNFFCEKLLFTGSTTKLQLETFDKNGDSVYAFRAYDNDMKEVRLGETTNNNGSFFIPFSDRVAREIVKRMSDPQQHFDSDIFDVSRYGIEYIKGYSMEDEYTIRIKLKDVSFEFVKTYNEQSETIVLNLLDDLPDILVWPNVEIQNWRTYFVSSVRNSSMRDGNYISVELPDTVYNEADKVKNNYETSPMGETVKVRINDKIIGSQSVSLNIKTDYIKVFPHLVKIVADGGSGFLFVPSKSSRQRKSILLTDDSIETIVGIDFGTTNTTAWIDDGEHGEFDARLTNSASVVRKLIYDKKVVHDVAAQLSADSLTYDSAAAPDGIWNGLNSDPIINSALLRYSSVSGADVDWPFLHGNIYRLDGEEISSKEGFLEQKNNGGSNLSHNMKWNSGSSLSRNLKSNSDEKKTDAEMKLFLLEFALMCCKAAIEKNGAGRIIMRASFPSSMPESRRRLLYDIWNPVVAELRELTGLDISDVAFFTESYCAGLVPQTSNSIYGTAAKPEQGYVCIDIGGGSTDISVFYNNDTPTAQISIPFGGRLFLSGEGNKSLRGEITQFLESLRLSIRKEYDKLPAGSRNAIADYGRKVDDYENVMKYMKSLGSDAYGTPNFILLTDLVIGGLFTAYQKVKSEGGFSGKTFATILKGLKNERSKHYLARIKFGLSALAFFIGKAIKKFESEEKFKIFEQHGWSLNLYFAGNGSRILDWYMENGEEAKFIRNAMAPQGVADIALAVFSEYIRLGYNAPDEPKKPDDKIANAKMFDIRIIRSNKPKLEAAMGLTQATGSSQLFDEENLDSLAPIGIDASLERFTDTNDFAEHLEKCFSKTVFKKRQPSNDYIYKLVEKGKDTIRNELINIVNPGYSIKKVTVETFYFMGVFKSISKNDATLLFPELMIDNRTDFESGKNKAINDKIMAQVNALNIAIRANTSWLSMPIADYTPYAILEYAKAILNGTF